MSVEEGVMTKKSKRSETHHGAPRRQMMMIEIIELRDKYKKSWEEIGGRRGMTRAGARNLYHKWYDWSKENRHLSRLVAKRAG